MIHTQSIHIRSAVVRGKTENSKNYYWWSLLPICCSNDSFHALIRCIDFKGIDETNRTQLRFETRHTLSPMSHKPNLLSWDQDVAASPREFHETDNNRTNAAALLATWQYYQKLSHYQKLSQIILSYFSNALSFGQGKRSFQSSGKVSSFSKITNQKIENHCCMTWRHTGIDQSTDVYPRDAPFLLVLRLVNKNLYALSMK